MTPDPTAIRDVMWPVIVALGGVYLMLKLATWGMGVVLWWQRRQVAHIEGRLRELRAERWRRETRR